LLFNHPDDLTLRKRLGEVYWALRHPAMAGRYWYLEEDASEDMAAARRAFERSCGNNALQMLFAIKFRGDLDRIEETHAGRTLVALQKQAKQQAGYAVRFDRHGHPTRDTSRWGWYGVGCLAIVGMAVLLMLIGAFTIVHGVLSRL